MSSNEKFERDFEAFLNGDDAQLSALYRKLPPAEPDAKLDAAVLAMAHRALNPQLVATPGSAPRSAARRRARWLPALGAAATAVFAIGVAVKMAPRMWTEQPPATPTAARDEGVVHVRPIDAPPAELPAAPLSPPPPPPQSAAASGALGGAREAAHAVAPKPAAPPAAPVLQKSVPVAAPPIAAEAPTAERVDEKKADNVASPAPRAFPNQPARSVEMDSVERKQAIAEGAWQRLHDADASAQPGGSERTAPAETGFAAPATRAKAPAPAGAAAGLAAPSRSAEEQKSVAADTVTVTGASVRRDDIETANPPPAKREAEAYRADKSARQEMAERHYSAETLRNAKLYPESWMAAIQRLIRAGRRDDARQNLELFREKYPQYHLPADVERFAREAR